MKCGHEAVSKEMRHTCRTPMDDPRWWFHEAELSWHFGKPVSIHHGDVNAQLVRDRAGPKIKWALLDWLGDDPAKDQEWLQLL